MSITHDSVTFSQLHGAIQTTRPEPSVQRTRFPGVRGETHIVGRPGARELSTTYIMKGYASKLLLDTAITALNQQVGVLTGTLTVTGSYAGVYGGCTFMGFEVEPGTQAYDPGGNGWYAMGRLVWLQRNPTG